MAKMKVPSTRKHITTLRKDLKQIKAGEHRRSPRNIISEATKKVAQETIHAIEETHRVKNSGSPEPMFVYHYTTLDTAIALLAETEEPNFLRMYSAAGFNDPDEGKFLYQSTIGLEEAQKQGFLPTYQHLGEVPFKATEPYIASFIIDEKGNPASNSLPYWNQYGDNSKGVALKIAVPRKEIYVVKYGEAEAQATIQVLQKNLGPLLEEIKKQDNESLLITARTTIQNQLQKLNYLYKSGYYRYEQECRIIEFRDTLEPNAEVEYKGKDHPFPFRSYINHPSLSTQEPNSIFKSGAEITIGPAVENRRDAQMFFNNLIAKSGQSHLQVKVSNIHHRKSSNR